ncbi:MAG: aerotolerance regulator BatA [Candidatus Cloacimonadota bacterium]|nr:MAG: aerotolerance regulator BatA [Candidatus Cloacimonadota bacterium]
MSQTFFHFKDPYYLLLILLVPVLYYWEFYKREPSIIYPSIARIKKIKPSLKVRLFPLRAWLKIIAFIFIVFGLARFQKGKKTLEVITHGVDIVLAIDTSGSMNALDFKLRGKEVDRLEVIKDVVNDFVKTRRSDRMGMIVFGTMAFTQCPLTLDHGVLLSFLKSLTIGMAGESTAIGSAIGTAVNRLKEKKSKSKILILLTDGANTAGDIDPIQAAEIAKAFGIKIYCIGVGSRGKVPIKIETPFGPQYQYIQSDLDETSLKKISKMTGGKYYRATDLGELKQIYTEIDSLEKSKSKVKEHMEYKELFYVFVIPAILLLLLYLLLDLTYFRRTP